MKVKLKNYTHFSAKLQTADIPFILKYVSTPQNIVRHKFFPLIHYTILEKKYKRLYNSHGEREGIRTYIEKKRQIFYANHLDNQVYSYYGQLINRALEEKYKEDSILNESVIGYRRIPANSNRNKCNIDFAGDVFRFIKKSKINNISVYCIDVTSFFDTLNHKIIKQAWSGLFNSTNLKPDHYQVFKAITQYTHVEIGDLINEFKEFNIKKFKFLKNKEIDSFCKNAKEFRDRVVAKDYVRFNKFIPDSERKERDFGIPQGLSISSTLSNLYMFEFDKHFSNLLHKNNGLYRRYSDDILFICSKDQSDFIASEINNYITTKLKLELQPQKTQVVNFFRSDSQDLSYKSYENGIETNKPLSYLGFEFDGHKILIKQKSLSKYYRRTKRIIRRRAVFAFFAKKKNIQNNKNNDEWIYRQGIYKSKSHLGAKKKKINGKLFRGNFISYIYSASKLLNEKSLKHQIRNHWKIIEKMISKYEQKYSLKKTPSKRSINKKKRNAGI